MQYPKDVVYSRTGKEVKTYLVSLDRAIYSTHKRVAREETDCPGQKAVYCAREETIAEE